MKPRSELDEDDEGREHPTPQWWMTDEEVEELEFDYPDRLATDFVISGPLGEAVGPGRRFKTWDSAERWAREFYGVRFKRRVEGPDEAPRWAFLVERLCDCGMPITHKGACACGGR